jgi:hypothetical protein
MKSQTVTSKPDAELAKWCEALAAGTVVAEVVPNGWFTTKELSKARGRSECSTSTSLMRMVEAGQGRTEDVHHPVKHPDATGAALPAQMKRVPTKRVAIDGKTWRVKIQRPPTRNVNDGLCEPNVRTVYIHPAAIADCGVETVYSRTDARPILRY